MRPSGGRVGRRGWWCEVGQAGLDALSAGRTERVQQQLMQVSACRFGCRQNKAGGIATSR